jgi:hypothetical protein
MSSGFRAEDSSCDRAGFAGGYGEAYFSNAAQPLLVSKVINQR